MRYVDLFWIIEPNFSQTLHFSISDFVVPLAIACLWASYFFYNLGSLPLLSAYDPSAGEVLETHHHQPGVADNA
jgi:hypothetical protein